MSSNRVDIKLDLKEMEKVIKMFSDAAYSARVGIFQKDSARDEGGAINNAELGMIHEYGSKKRNIPARSFLRVPLMDHFRDYLNIIGGIDETTIQNCIEAQNLKPLFREIATIAEATVKGAFDSQGFGNWKPHKPGYKNNTGMILQDTQSLKKSIASDVKRGES